MAEPMNDAKQAISCITGEPLWEPDWTVRDLLQRIINKKSRVYEVNRQINVLLKEREDHDTDIEAVEAELERRGA